MSEACGRAQVAPPQLFDRKYSRFEPAQTCKPLESPHLSNKWHQLDKGLHPKRVGVIVDASQLFALFHWGYWQWMSIMSAFFINSVQYCIDLTWSFRYASEHTSIMDGQRARTSIESMLTAERTFPTSPSRGPGHLCPKRLPRTLARTYVFFVWLDRLRAHHFCITSSVLRRGATKILPSVLAKLGLG